MHLHDYALQCAAINCAVEWFAKIINGANSSAKPWFSRYSMANTYENGGFNNHLKHMVAQTIAMHYMPPLISLRPWGQ